MPPAVGCARVRNNNYVSTVRLENRTRLESGTANPADFSSVAELNRTRTLRSYHKRYAAFENARTSPTPTEANTVKYLWCRKPRDLLQYVCGRVRVVNFEHCPTI